MNNKISTAWNRVNLVIDKLSDWSCHDLSELNDEYGLYEAQEIVDEALRYRHPVIMNPKLSMQPCPRCGELIMHRVDFCYMCGQAFDYGQGE